MRLMTKHLLNLVLFASMLVTHYILSILLNHNPAILPSISVTNMQAPIWPSAILISSLFSLINLNTLIKLKKHPQLQRHKTPFYSGSLTNLLLPWVFIIPPWLEPSVHLALAMLILLSALTFIISYTIATWQTNHTQAWLNQYRLGLSISAFVCIVTSTYHAPTHIYRTLPGKTASEITHIASQIIPRDYPTHALFEWLFGIICLLFLTTLIREIRTITTPGKTTKSKSQPH